MPPEGGTDAAVSKALAGVLCYLVGITQNSKVKNPHGCGFLTP